jgi:cytosine/adenosine deaminase-related metal-dependent hydrolase
VPHHDCAIEAGWALVDRDGEQELVRDVTIVVREDTIADVVEGRLRGREKRVDARDFLVLPGFISGHTHACGSAPARGLVESGRFFDRPLSILKELDDDVLDVVTAHNLAELLRTGCTTILEMARTFRIAESHVRVARRWGLRVYLSVMIPTYDHLFDVWFRTDDSVLHDSVPRTLAEIERARQFGHSINGAEDGRILAQMGPHAPNTHTPETLTAAMSAARELGNGIQIHLCQEPREIETVQRLWGKRPVAWLEELGLFSVEPVFTAHLAEADGQELATLARHNVTFAHCSSCAALFLGSTQPLPEALAAGLNVSLGIDMMQNDYVDNVRSATLHGQIRYSHLHERSKAPMRRPTIRDTVWAATRGGADGLRRSDLGRIAPGAKADLCAIDISGPFVGSGSLPPEPFNNLLYANGQHVRHVMTAGYFQVFNGELTVDDFDRVVSSAGAVARDIWALLDEEEWFDTVPEPGTRVYPAFTPGLVDR